VGNAFSYQFTATGGSGSGYTFSTNSALPPGLTLSPEGLLSGTPTDDTGSPFTLDVMVTDDQGASATSGDLSLPIQAAITASPATLPAASLNVPYSQQLTASGGSGTGFVFSATGLPDGLTIDANGLITGTPTVYDGSPYNVVVTVTDSDGATGDTTYAFVVNGPLAITPTTIPTAYAGVAYSQQLTGTGGSGSGYVFSSADVPAGLTLSPDGLLSGEFATTGGSPFSFTVTVTDDQGATFDQAYTLDVSRSESTIGLMTSGSPGVFGQTVTFTAWVQSGGPVVATPTGTITFFDGPDVLAVVPIVGGAASLDVSTLSPGTHEITAAYNGDDLFNDSLSSVVVQEIKIQATASLTASSTAAGYGQPITFTMNVATQDSIVPTGRVGFYDGDALIGIANLDATGSASLEVSDLAVGSHTIKAIYEGDDNYLAVAADPVDVAVSQNDSTAVAIAASPSQVYAGQTLTLTATITADSSGSAPTGTVTFYDNGTAIGTADLVPFAPTTAAQPGLAAQVAPLVTASATLANVALGVGSHNITAVYSGDGNYAPATSSAATDVTVSPAQTSTTLTAKAQPDGTTVLTAVVAATTPGNPPIEGSVSFYNGDALLGTVPVSDGSASLNIGALTGGSQVLRAVYSGGDETASSSATLVIDATGPQVAGLSRYGFHYSATTLVLTFNSALDPATAQTVSNYTVTNSAGRQIPISRAVYDASTWTVTLYPSQRLNLHWTYTLVVNGKTPDGVTGASGIPLDGSGQGQPGTDFTAAITWRALAKPGDSPAIVYNNGVAETTTARFSAYVNNIVRRTRQAMVRAVRPVAARPAAVARPVARPVAAHPVVKAAPVPRAAAARALAARLRGR
jgi:hypothetical protein